MLHCSCSSAARHAAKGMSHQLNCHDDAMNAIGCQRVYIVLRRPRITQDIVLAQDWLNLGGVTRRFTWIWSGELGGLEQFRKTYRQAPSREALPWEGRPRWFPPLGWKLRFHGRVKQRANHWLVGPQAPVTGTRLPKRAEWDADHLGGCVRGCDLTFFCGSRNRMPSSGWSVILCKGDVDLW